MLTFTDFFLGDTKHGSGSRACTLRGCLFAFVSICKWCLCTMVIYGYVVYADFHVVCKICENEAYLHPSRSCGTLLTFGNVDYCF